MPDKFDPYRESLIVEKVTVWPESYADLPAADKERIAELLHSEPQSCSHLEYVRLHSGFCRTITVTEADVERVGVT